MACSRPVTAGSGMVQATWRTQLSLWAGTLDEVPVMECSSGPGEPNGVVVQYPLWLEPYSGSKFYSIITDHQQKCVSRAIHFFQARELDNKNAFVFFVGCSSFAL